MGHWEIKKNGNQILKSYKPIVDSYQVSSIPGGRSTYGENEVSFRHAKTIFGLITKSTLLGSIL